MESVVRTSLTQFVFLWNTVQMQALQNVRLRESSVYLKTQEAYVNKITLLKYPDLVLVLYEIYIMLKNYRMVIFFSFIGYIKDPRSDSHDQSQSIPQIFKTVVVLSVITKTSLGTPSASTAIHNV
jgi:hypothetical protein